MSLPDGLMVKTLILRLICEKISQELTLEQLGGCGGTHL